MGNWTALFMQNYYNNCSKKIKEESGNEATLEFI